MKKIGLVGIVILGVILAIAIISAGKMGETSHAFAEGTIKVDPQLFEKAQGIETLFIVMTGPDRPMPLGALRKSVKLKENGDLYRFLLTKDNMQMMMGDQTVPESFKLKARLDSDGQAGPDQPGDLVGEALDVKRGQKGIEIVISKVIP